MAPTPVLFAANARAVRMLGDLPPWVRGDPDIRAVIYCQAKEMDRAEAELDHLTDQFFPTRADTMGLPWWEALTRVAASIGQPVESRRAVVLSSLARLIASPSGSRWEETVTALIGTDYTYVENTPGSYQLRITVPFPPTSGSFAALNSLLDVISPAHIDVVLQFVAGFLVDDSQLDQEGLG